MWGCGGGCCGGGLGGCGGGCCGGGVGGCGGGCCGGMIVGGMIVGGMFGCLWLRIHCLQSFLKNFRLWADLVSKLSLFHCSTVLILKLCLVVFSLPGWVVSNQSS